MICAGLTQSQITVVDVKKEDGSFGWRELTKEESEERKYKSSVMEGIGSQRLYANLVQSKVDHSFRVTDKAAINMAHFVLKKEGIFIGPSSAHNLASAFLGPFSIHFPEYFVFF